MDLQARVEKLEREIRRTKRVGIIVAIIVLAGVTMGAARKNYAAFDWVSAYGFTIRDGRNTRDRGGLAYDPEIGPYFYLKDKEGHTKVKITLDGATRR